MNKKTQTAFDEFLRDPAAIEGRSALLAAGAKLSLVDALLRFGFVAGAKYAVDRCTAENHAHHGEVSKS